MPTLEKKEAYLVVVCVGIIEGRMDNRLDRVKRVEYRLGCIEILSSIVELVQVQLDLRHSNRGEDEGILRVLLIYHLHHRLQEGETLLVVLDMGQCMSMGGIAQADSRPYLCIEWRPSVPSRRVSTDLFCRRT